MFLIFFSPSRNFVEKETGVKPLMLFNSLYDATISQDSVDLLCGYIRKLNPDYLVVGEGGTKLFVFKNKTLCGNYFVEKVEGIKDDYFAKRIAQ